MKKPVKIAIGAFVGLAVISGIAQQSNTQNTPPEESVSNVMSSAVPSVPPSTTDNADTQAKESEPDSKTDSEPAEEAPFVEKYDNEIVVSSKMVLDNFINDYKIPLAPQLWTIADFDEDGAVMAIADITEKSTEMTQKAIIVLTPIMQEDKMTGCTPHYVSVGSTVYGDDGYCDEFFSNIEDALDAWSGQ